MGRVLYDSNRIIPAPLVDVQKVYQKTEDGENIGSSFTLTIRGKIVAYMGSPMSNGTFWTAGGYPSDETITSNARLAAIMRKQEALRTLFSDEGRQLEFQSLDGSQPMKCNPRNVSISFAEGQWFDICDYTITCEADVVYVNGQALGEDEFSQYLESASETWSFEVQEDLPESLELPKTYRVTHSIQAKGKRFYDDTGALVRPAWQQAREWSVGRLGLDNVIMLDSGVNNLPSFYGGFNHLRSSETNELGGTYSITESWILASGTALEEFNIDTQTSSSTGLSTVKIDGTVTGLEHRDSNYNLLSSKYDNADTKFNTVSSLALSRAQDYSNLTLNIQPLSTSIGRSPIRGTINYSYEYDDRPSNIITGAKIESISIHDNLSADIFASNFVLGRSAGPVLQSTGATRGLSRTLNIELVMPVPSFGSNTLAEIANVFNNTNPRVNPTTAAELAKIIAAADPEQLSAVKNFVSEHDEDWEPKTGHYTFSKSWTYEL